VGLVPNKCENGLPSRDDCKGVVRAPGRGGSGGLPGCDGRGGKGKEGVYDGAAKVG
jgi:hypothetical protein